MNESTKISIVTVVGFATLAAIFAIMADCSKTVARVNAEGAACAAKGGEWKPHDGPSGGTGYCIERRK